MRKDSRSMLLIKVLLILALFAAMYGSREVTGQERSENPEVMYVSIGVRSGTGPVTLRHNTLFLKDMEQGRQFQCEHEARLFIRYYDSKNYRIVFESPVSGVLPFSTILRRDIPVVVENFVKIRGGVAYLRLAFQNKPPEGFPKLEPGPTMLDCR